MKLKIKLLIIIISLLMILPFVKVNAEEKSIPVKTADGNGYVTYIGTNVQVTIPNTYTLPETSFRAVWVSAFTGDISGFSTEAQYKQEIIDVLNILDYYNINAMIFHVRARNDAFYQSKYNKWSQYYNSDPSWDALPWVINECHKRGIEFHAWLNPYRVATSSANLEDLSKNFKATNPASNPKNLLKAESCVILNPGLPNVRTFLINTCMELIENYDIDAIHFDDYFYASGVDDSETYAMYNEQGLSLSDWRREQVNLFIKGLSDAMRSYNEKTGRRVQLGIAPSGIWRSAGGNSYVKYDENGNAISNGSSTTSSFEHYGGHLYADTLKWINEEWIDYILPQTYWAMEHSSAGYPDLVKWWAEVVKYKNVNLYVSLGMYMRNESGGSSWKTNDLEGYNQIMYGSNYETVQGYSVYEFKSLKAAANGSDRSFKKVNELWSRPAILPEIRTMEKIEIDSPEKVTIGIVKNGYKVQIDAVDKAKFYVVYRSDKELSYSPDEVIDIIGNVSYDGKINYVDLVDTSKNYYYGVRAQSYSLTLTEGVSANTVGCKTIEEAPIEQIETIITSSNFIENSSLEVKWRKIYHNIGGEVEYELYYSTDNKTWIKNEREIVLNDGKGYVSTNLRIPLNSNKLYLKVKAYNSCGESISEIKEINIYKNLGIINHFGVVGDEYCENKVEFVWNNLLEYSNIKYTLQKSYDKIVYEDIEEVPNTSNINIRFNYTLPKETGKVYYRVKGEVDGRVGYSEEIILNVKGSLGEISDFTIDEEKIKDYYVLEEEDILEISFSTKSSVTYSPKLSRDGISWIIASKYHSNNKLELAENKNKQILFMSGMDLKLYFFIEANKDDYNSNTKIIEFYIIPEVIFYDDLIYFMKKEQENILFKTTLFN